MKHTFYYLILVTGLFGWLSFFGCVDTKTPPVPPVVVDTVVDSKIWVCHAITDPPTLTDRAVALKNKQWPNGTILTYLHLQATSTQKEDFRRACDDWEANSNIKFVEVLTGAAKLRVSWQPGQGAWSYLGADCASIPQTSPTMNIGFTGASRYYDVCLHELGHTLSLSHEHQNPDNPFVFDKPNVYRDLQGSPNWWTVPQIDFNVITPHQAQNVIATKRDDRSIMMYGMPATWFVNRIGVAGGKVLSEVDKSFISTLYPKSTPPPNPGTVTISKATRDNIVRLETLAKLYADSSLLVTKKATGL